MIGRKHGSLEGVSSPPLPRDFYIGDTVEIARSLVGCILVRRELEDVLVGRIVEAEAYLQDDPACHSFRGLRPRNAVMFGPAGHAYIYFTYGMHWCLNAVTQPEGRGDAVLIRALEPLQGLDVMRRNRGVDDLKRLTRGPGCVTQALGLGKAENGEPLDGQIISIHAPDSPVGEIIAGPRVGLTVAIDQPWRFFVAGSPFVSRRPRPRPRATESTPPLHRGEGESITYQPIHADSVASWLPARR